MPPRRVGRRTPRVFAAVSRFFEIPFSFRPERRPVIGALRLQRQAEEIVRADGVRAARIERPAALHQLLHPFKRTDQFVAPGKHDEGRMIAVNAQDRFRFALEIGPFRLVFESGFVIPIRQLRLQIHAFLIGGGEGGLRRTPGMEAVMVDSIRFRGLKQPLPRRFVHGRVSGQRKYAGVMLVPQKNALPVERKLAALCAKLARTATRSLYVSPPVCASKLTVSVYIAGLNSSQSSMFSPSQTLAPLPGFILFGRKNRSG